eukprot:SAG25_NODE_53_length_18703_cov_126.779104_6_plen_75_part_00
MPCQPATLIDASLSTVKLLLTFSEVLTNSTPVEGSDSKKFPKPRLPWLLLSLCCGPEISWEICAVAYSPVYFRP